MRLFPIDSHRDSASIQKLGRMCLFQTCAHLYLLASTGAACHSNPSHGPSGAIAAINVPPDFASGTLRLSTGEFTTLSDVNNVAHVLAAKVLALSLHDIR